MLNTRDEALALLRRYNKEPFHLQHALTVEGVMRWYANELGYGQEADFWAMVGLLHDIDFEQLARGALPEGPGAPPGGRRRGGADPRRGQPRLRPVLRCGAGPRDGEGPLRRRRAHGPDLAPPPTCAPAAASSDMEVSSLKKKFKDKKFAAGCSRDVIRQGAERLGWDLETLMERTILAMRACEADVASAMAAMAE